MFLIGIPTLNRLDLLEPSLEKYLNDFNGIQIVIIDNGNQNVIELARRLNNKIKDERIKVITPGKNLGVAASWNLLCRMAFDNDFDNILLLNDDIYCGYGTEVVLKAIENSKTGIVQSFHNWSVLLLSKKLYEKIGAFDEVFYPAYYEDSDYLYRLKLNGILHEVDASLNPEIALRSMTQEKNPELVNESMQANRLRYIDKWGGSPLLEKYDTPYDLKW